MKKKNSDYDVCFITKKLISISLMKDSKTKDKLRNLWESEARMCGVNVNSK